MSGNKAVLHVKGHKPIELPILKGSMGPEVINVRSLSQLGLFTYDPGFKATASCDSNITFIDGEKGTLLYRGYPIDQLAENADFLQVCYLLMYGDAPSQEQSENFSYLIKHHTLLHEQLTTFFRGFRRDAHPMAVMVGIVGALSSFYHDTLDIDNPEHREKAAFRLIAKMPTIAAMCYKYSTGLPFVYPNNNMGYAENFLHMMFSTPCEEYQVNPVIADAVEKIFILHADHEQNASTSTVRMSGSSGANPFACISAGIASLWGPSHGGANEACLHMLEEIGTVDRVPEFIARAKDKNDSFRLMGFGHRVYKNYDPRAKVMRETCHQVLEELELEDPLLEVAIELERIALSDPYFVERKLYPNVDFYSGITLRAIGIPVSMFTVIFAIARTVGWLSHWLEMHEEPISIGRPRQLYTGMSQRNFIPMRNR